MTEERFVGFAPEEIDTAAPTRSARLKWVVVVQQDLPAGRAVNAAACVAAAIGAGVQGLLGPDAVDADGSAHPGLPWAGCSVLSAPAAQLGAIRAKAAGSDGVLVVDMPEAGQLTRVYDEYLEVVGDTVSDALNPLAVALVGPRNRVDRIVGRLPLLA
ncbi:DUF2000 domain-containing protein [Plantibacter sp. MCCC 1A11337]|uniref:DUF2000 domain-containing protein n=1 Tax=Plantibacter sp. MCCC 1A11337 TaxID=2736644 RepID=UPI000EABB8E9|nr:DUF2000 domain-containing protein [Plantibacter sp. MCCC 1A11337]NUJ88588.1 DUF2000 domain-containing protein [Plantibacter sp. MCCC 1A11337]